ncbi:MAG: MBL fold metallo-hydrolase [Phycisphaerae bacterium]|nr:MBL fold metallo-hydrolase [Phycisphaerae bacterium]
MVEPNSNGAQISIQPFALGPWETNCYVVTPGERRDCWIVDASFDPDDLVDHIRRLGLTPRAILLTHAHVDHIAGLGQLRRAFPGVPVLLHGAEHEWLSDPMLNLSAMTGRPVSEGEPDGELSDGQELTLGPSRWVVRHTPGHSPGGVTLYCADAGVALVGDSLFNGSIGRTDFPGSSPGTLAESIRRVLYALPPQTRVFPGHGPPTTIGREMKSNPFVRA